MKYSLILTFLISFTLCSCQLSNPEGIADLFDGKKLAGTWTPVKSIIVLRYENGYEQNVTVEGKPGDFMEFKYTKTTGHKSEGTLTSFTAVLNETATGTWFLEQDKAELTMINIPFQQFRRIDELDAHKLIMSADDKMIRLFVEVNDLNQGSTNKIVGGSAFDEYKR